MFRNDVTPQFCHRDPLYDSCLSHSMLLCSLFNECEILSLSYAAGFMMSGCPAIHTETNLHIYSNIYIQTSLNTYVEGTLISDVICCLD